MLMDRKILREWVEALRSDTYRQCAGDYVLFDESTGDRSYCALGVLADVANKKGYMEINLLEHKENTLFDRLYMLIHSDPYEFSFSDVIGWNDTEEMSFKDIANKLEDYYELGIE